MTTRPMTKREKIALNNTSTCLFLDKVKESYWTTVMTEDLQIVIDYLKETEK